MLNTQQSQNLNEFLLKHKVKPDEKPTHTRIPDSKMKCYGGSYHISKEELNEMYKFYYQHVFVEKNNEYITEKQLDDNGPILIDIDLRYDYKIVERIHTYQHIEDLILLYLEELKLMIKFTEETLIPIYVFEKPNVNRLDDGSLTKDGIHIIIGVQLERCAQMILREKIISKIGETWGDELPIINNWETVFDDGITKGSSNWQMYGSRKPGNQAYELKYYFMITFDIHDGEIMMEQRSIDDCISSSSIEDSLYKLSAQYDQHQKFEYKEDFAKMLEEKKSKKVNNKLKSTIKIVNNTNTVDDTEIINIEDINNFDILKRAIENIMKNLSMDEYYIREAHAYTQILPEKFYEPGSHVLNTQVALALKHTDERLFLSWIMLRSKATDFDYSTIPKLYERWNKYIKSKENGVTNRSIIYWAKENSRELYENVKREMCEEHYIDYTIEQPTDFDLARVLYQIFKDKYICSCVTNKTWYVFKNHRWELDKGNCLRKAISTDMYSIYKKKLNKLTSEILTMDLGDVRMIPLKKKVNKIQHVINMMKTTSDKNNIMREAVEIFYDPDFTRNMDSNRWLICFRNGVVDLKEKIFRNGLPTDYITKSTNIDYEEFNENCDPNIVNQVTTFMQELFPDPSLNNYMWDHLSSVLIGINQNQTFHIYHGRGSNGKSMLTDLMFMTMGEYAGSVPVSIITDKRPAIGGTSSEIMQLKGIRYAVMAEPKKGDKINEGIMKQLTGDATISARSLYCESETFAIQFHLVVCTNTLFEVTSHDDGTWRRIRVCDFESKFYEPEEYKDYRGRKEYKHLFPKNKNLKENMKKWISIFAGMLVKRAFEKRGEVSNCIVVKTRTDQYRRESDYIASFVLDKIKRDNREGDKPSVLRMTDIHDEFKLWYGLHAPKEKLPKINEIKEYIINKFGKMSSDVNGWTGLVLIRENEGTKVDDDDDDDVSIHAKSDINALNAV
jgi:P4 family phage/plasmid primase-like protien